MKLEKAIDLIQADINDEDIEWGSPLGRAYKLSFEALKVVQSNRIYGYPNKIPKLPGETEDTQTPTGEYIFIKRKKNKGGLT